MKNYTLENYWIPRLREPFAVPAQDLAEGWSFENSQSNSFFKEAPLTLSTEQFGQTADAMSSPIVLVSAPGAVGKSTLAKQISAETGSVYVDLVKSGPVAAHSLSGGLMQSGIYPLWENEKIAVLLDGLDEAILKTTQEGFERFLDDIVMLSASRNVPTVLFGRTGIVQDAWLLLDEMYGGNVPVLEIGYYDEKASIEFSEAQLKQLYPARRHPAVDKTALTLILRGIRRQTEREGDRFAGYAPVLQAVARQVGEESNPGRLVSELEGGEESSITLFSVIRAILDREQDRIKELDLTFEDPSLVNKLFSPDEQLDHLVSRVYHVPEPLLPDMSARDAQTYSDVLRTRIVTHPFLNDDDSKQSLTVFDAVICIHALKNNAAVSEAVRRELSKGEKANPFLYVFYMGENLQSETHHLPEEQIGVIYSSIRASLAQGDTANLLVEESEDVSEEEMQATVEIEVNRHLKNPDQLRFQTERLGPICLGSHVRDVTISMPSARVEIGPSAETLLVAPVTIQCAELAILAKKVIVDSPPKSKTRVVYLHADNSIESSVTSFPVARKATELCASWPGVEIYPWTNFATQPQSPPTDDPQVDEALRRFKNFIVAFRARGNEELARFQGKIDSQRMIKGTGQAVLTALLKARIIILDSGWYFLNADLLGELTDTKYEDCIKHQFSSKAVEFVKTALKENTR